MARENSTKLVKQPTLQRTLNRMCGSSLVSTFPLPWNENDKSWRKTICTQCRCCAVFASPAVKSTPRCVSSTDNQTCRKYMQDLFIAERVSKWLEMTLTNAHPQRFFCTYWPSFIKPMYSRMVGGAHSFPRTDRYLSIWTRVQATTQSHPGSDLAHASLKSA